MIPTWFMLFSKAGNLEPEISSMLLLLMLLLFLADCAIALVIEISGKDNAVRGEGDKVAAGVVDGIGVRTSGAMGGATNVGDGVGCEIGDSTSTTS